MLVFSFSLSLLESYILLFLAFPIILESWNPCLYPRNSTFFYQIIGQVQKSFHVMTSLFSVSVDERFGSHNKTLSTFPSLFHSTGAQSLYFLLSGLDRCFVSSILGFLTSLSMSLSPCSGSFSLSSTSAGLLLIKLFCFCLS